MNASIRVQHKHEPAMKAVRVNWQITEVMQPQDQSNSKMVTIYILPFFSGRNIWQICQILLTSWNFGQTQLTTLVHSFRENIISRGCFVLNNDTVFSQTVP